MTRNEHDLRDALHDLARRADGHDAPSTSDIVSTGRPAGAGHATVHRFPRWAPPLAAAVAVAAVAVIAVAVGTSGNGPSTHDRQAGGRPRAAVTTSASSTPSTHETINAPPPTAAAILDSAATQLGTASWTAPSPREFYYVRTNQATSWISVSGTRAGRARSSDGTRVFNGACHHGHLVDGMSGTCTVDDVPHYLADAPTDPSAWDAYLEQLAPGSRAGNAQGKIIVQVLHQDLTAPRAAAALLRYTESCPGLHTVVTRPVAGEKLIGVTCTSMTNGSYGLAFDAGTDAFVGFVPVDYQTGKQDYQAEIIRQAGVVKAIGERP